MFGVEPHQKDLTVLAMYNTFTKNIMSISQELPMHSQKKVKQST